MVFDGFWTIVLLRRGGFEATLGARQAIPRALGGILGAVWGLGKPLREARWCILGLGRLMLQILEAILWPRGLPRTNMSD